MGLLETCNVNCIHTRNQEIFGAGVCHAGDPGESGGLASVIGGCTKTGPAETGRENRRRGVAGVGAGCKLTVLWGLWGFVKIGSVLELIRYRVLVERSRII